VESPYKAKPLLARPFIALRCAFAGIAAAWRHEVAFRLEVIAVVLLVPFALLAEKGGIERALLIGSLLLVLIVELGNSALEAALDRISLETHPLTGRAKDIGSAAVFFALVNAAAIWLVILLS
jgi:diacylglycerol kinase (ATP)